MVCSDSHVAWVFRGKSRDQREKHARSSLLDRDGGVFGDRSPCLYPGGTTPSSLEWWIRKVLNALWVFCVVFVLLYMWGRDPKIALSGASAGFVGYFVAALLQRKQLVNSAAQK